MPASPECTDAGTWEVFVRGERTDSGCRPKDGVVQQLHQNVHQHGKSAAMLNALVARAIGGELKPRFLGAPRSRFGGGG